MAVYTATTNLTDGQGTFRAIGTDFDVSVDGGGVPLEADDRANLAAGRMVLKTGGPGPTPATTYGNVVVSKPGGLLYDASNTGTPLSVGSGAAISAPASPPSTLGVGEIAVVEDPDSFSATIYLGIES